MDNNISSEFIASNIREALNHLGSITGNITNDTLLKNIFPNFVLENSKDNYIKKPYLYKVGFFFTIILVYCNISFLLIVPLLVIISSK